jgi:hypothetical protein
MRERWKTAGRVLFEYTIVSGVLFITITRLHLGRGRAPNSLSCALGSCLLMLLGRAVRARTN